MFAASEGSIEGAAGAVDADGGGVAGADALADGATSAISEGEGAGEGGARLDVVGGVGEVSVSPLVAGAGSAVRVCRGVSGRVGRAPRERAAPVAAEAGWGSTNVSPRRASVSTRG